MRGLEKLSGTRDLNPQLRCGADPSAPHSSFVPNRIKPQPILAGESRLRRFLQFLLRLIHIPPLWTR